MNLTNNVLNTDSRHSLKLPASAKILFAAFPGDGHFNPLTGLAVHLKEQGYDVRFYTASAYREKVQKMDIPFFPFVRARELDVDKIDETFPDRKKHKSQVAKLNHDIINVFIKQGPEYYEDLKAVRQTFPFDLMIADVLFTGIPWVTDLMKIPVIGVGIVPITANSKNLPPAGMGMLPSYTFFGQMKQALLRWMGKNILFAKSNKVMKKVLGSYGITCNADSVFDLMPGKCNLVLQSGTPGFEYSRNDLDEKYKFVGPLLPYSNKKQAEPWYDERLTTYKKVVLVTQGTVEKDNTKLLVPTLEALRNTGYLLVVTTGGSNTEKLRQQYAASNIIIEDFIPFADIMPYADVYVTNGGMGGVQLSIENKLPMVTAGVHEGKNEICARVGYFNLGVNLKTERPTSDQILKAVEQVTDNDLYRKNVEALSKEFSRYNPNELCERYVLQILPQTKRMQAISAEASVY
ncbi:MAG TPA: nucleotide disphospho-sugar-binding domain-containing protein [Flavisolibacter sp.]|nr:nucleotide disphospho-sugar-binding domain-containing protein [Flavisolibacter sp.]